MGTKHSHMSCVERLAFKVAEEPHTPAFRYQGNKKGGVFRPPLVLLSVLHILKYAPVVILSLEYYIRHSVRLIKQVPQTGEALARQVGDSVHLQLTQFVRVEVSEALVPCVNHLLLCFRDIQVVKAIASDMGLHTQIPVLLPTVREQAWCHLWHDFLSVRLLPFRPTCFTITSDL